MAICSNKLFGFNLECTRRVGYGGLYAEMIHNNRLMNGICVGAVREILIPDGVWMNIESGEGELTSLPPASAAFIRI